MKVLVISHNVLGRFSNMGKTLRSYLSALDRDCVAQFYIHSEVPTDDSICRNYYRFTDRDAIRALNPFRTYGSVFIQADIRADRSASRTDKGIVGNVYQLGRKRSGLIYLARNILWKLSRWNTSRLWSWVEEFDPDVVFFASGDYGFMYDIARRIAQRIHKPLVVACVDDCYLHNRNESSLLGRIQHRLFLKTVHRTMARAEKIFTICEPQKREYETLFGKPCHVLHTAASAAAEETEASSGQISYLGNLSLGRAEQLAAMGQAMKKLGGWIDVYSGERNPEYRKGLTEENGIRFHGAVPAAEVLKIMASSKAVIHTESFDAKFKAITRYSVSTKIADSLMNGPCIIAYGPEGIASVDYLKENRAAYVIPDPEGLEAGLKEILGNEKLRQEIVNNARTLAAKNHDPQTNPARVKAWLEEVCREWENK